MKDNFQFGSPLGVFNFQFLKNFRKRSLQTDKGQVVLILVLITVVGLVIGLSLVARSITDVRISSQIEQSSRAFSAAEAGVESALKGATVGGPASSGIVTLPGASADYSVTGLAGSGDTYLLPATTVGTSRTVWLVSHSDDGNTLKDIIDETPGLPYPPSSSLDICWGLQSSGVPAVVISLIYKEGSTYKLAKGAYDPTPIGRTVIVNGNPVTINDNFDVSDSGSFCDNNFPYKKTIKATDFDVGAGAILLALRIQPLYYASVLAVKPAATLPLQGKKITSVGHTETGVARKVQVIEEYKSLPAIFDFTLFSENGIN
jgi:hypothetical protein